VHAARKSRAIKRVVLEGRNLISRAIQKEQRCALCNAERNNTEEQNHMNIEQLPLPRGAEVPNKAIPPSMGCFDFSVCLLAF